MVSGWNGFLEAALSIEGALLIVVEQRKYLGTEPPGYERMDQEIA